MKIPVGLSNHHAHITKEVGEILFGKDHELVCKRELKQIGEFACEEIVDVVINGKTLEHVRLIGPYRKYNQVELLHKDCEFLEIKDIRRNSGDLEGTHPFTLITPYGKYESEKGAFVANNHIHLSSEELEESGLSLGDIVSVKTKDNIMLNDIFIKSDSSCSLEFHLNKDEGENLGINTFDEVEIYKEK